MGLVLEIRSEELNINQEEEHKKSVSFGNYVNGMIAALQAESPELVEIAALTLGIDLPDDAMAMLKQLAQVQEQKREERRQEMAANMAQASQPEQSDEDLNDERKAIELDALRKFIKNGTHFIRPFHSDILTREEIRNEIERYEYEHSFGDKAYRP